MGKVGRPEKGREKRTPETIAKIVELIEAGNFRQVAAQAAGITGPTLSRWIKADDKLRAKIEAAESNAETTAVKAVLSSGDWKAMSWFLERKFPERWAQTHKQQADATIKDLQARKLEAEIKVLEQRAADPGADRAPLIPGSPEHDAMLLQEWGVDRTGTTKVKADDEGAGEAGKPPSNH